MPRVFLKVIFANYMKHPLIYLFSVGLFLTLSCHLYSFESQKEASFINAFQNNNTSTTFFKNKPASTLPIPKNDIFNWNDNDENFSSLKKSAIKAAAFLTIKNLISFRFIIISISYKILKTINFSRLPRFNFISLGVLRL